MYYINIQSALHLSLGPNFFLPQIFSPYLAALAALYLYWSFTHSSINHSSFKAIDAAMRAYLIRYPLTSLNKQVEGYIRPDNLQLPHGHYGRHSHWSWQSKWSRWSRAGQTGQTGQK